MEFIPIGRVDSPVTEAVDDVWGGVISRIELDPSRFAPDCLLGLDGFSHVEIVFFLIAFENRRQSVVRDIRVAVKSRPNRLGVTICRLISVGGLSITVEGLDAIDGTPVLDIKPYMQEFGPRGQVRQPKWATELMSEYWRGEN